MNEGTGRISVAARNAPGARPAIRFEALDSWRGLAALMVVLFHAQIVSNIRSFGIVRAGDAFVDFFFVLSGFVIAHAYLERLSTWRELGTFFVLRLGRLYPLHMFMLVLFLLFELAKAFLPGFVNAADPAFTGTDEVSYLLSNVLLAHALWPFDTLSWNTPSWSISAEFIAYVLFALAVFMQRSRIIMWLGLAIVAAPLLLALAPGGGMGEVAGIGALRAVYGFAGGTLLYVLCNRSILALHREHAGDAAHIWAWTAAEVAVSAVAVAFAWKTHGTSLSYGLPFVFMLVVGVFAVERGHVSRLLRLRLFLLIGTLSYSIYMTHMFVQLRMLNAARLSDVLFHTSSIAQVGRTARYGEGIDTGSLLIGDLLVVAMVMITIAVSYMTWRLVEKPGQRLFRRFADQLFAPAGRKGRSMEPVFANAP